MRGAAIRVGGGVDGEQCVDQAAIGVAIDDFALPAAGDGQLLPQLLVELPVVVAGAGNGWAFAAQLVLRHACHQLIGRVGRNDMGVRRGDDDRVFGVFEHQLVEPAAFFCLLPLADFIFQLAIGLLQVGGAFGYHLRQLELFCLAV